MIFVTGASGNVGSAVVDYLRSHQIPVRIGSRSPSHDAVLFDFLDPSTYEAAVQGCDAIFLFRPPAVANTKETLNRLIDVARSQNVRHIVFISVAGAGDNPMVPHHATEQHLKQGSQDWTILRPGFFAQNLGDAYREDIVKNDRIFLPAGGGRVAFIDTRDLSEVAAKILMNPTIHRGKTYTLTGAKANTFYEVAEMLSEELDRTITYRPASIPGYCLHLFRRKTPLEQILIFTILHIGLRFGQAETVDETLPQWLEHPSRSIRDYIRDRRELWLKSV